MNFQDIIGQERIIENLKRAFKNNKLSHSYLFQGADGIGKKMTALAFSKALLCKEKGEEPCNRCSSCVKFETGNHPDFFLIQPDRDIIRKEQIEDVISDINFKPFESSRKIYVIDDSQKMTREAQNCFLKTLEEPPDYAIFFLIIGQNMGLLPTILSRCEIIKFFPVRKDELEKFLISKYKKSKEEAEFISSYSKGSVEKAISIASSDEFVELREETIKIITDIVEGNSLKPFTSMEFFIKNEKKKEEIFNIILYWFRDIYLYKELKKKDLIINKDKLKLISDQTFLDIDKINDIIDNVQYTKNNIDRKANYQLSIETMLLNIQEG